jgi:hypothetical protein
MIFCGHSFVSHCSVKLNKSTALNWWPWQESTSDQKEVEQLPLHPPQTGHVKLAVFWLQVPVFWFAQAECAFPIKHVDAQFDHYCHVVSALPHKSLCLIADLVECEPSATLYELWPRKLKILCKTPYNLDFSMYLGMENIFLFSYFYHDGCSERTTCVTHSVQLFTADLVWSCQTLWEDCAANLHASHQSSRIHTYSRKYAGYELASQGSCMCFFNNLLFLVCYKYFNYQTDINGSWQQENYKESLIKGPFSE